MVAAASILVLEDDQDVRELLEYAFSELGEHVEACTTPDQLFHRAAKAPDALAVVDFWGRSHRTLAADERTELVRLARAMPTILITGRVWAERLAAEDLGLLAVVKKPFDVFDLAERVCRLAVQLRASRSAVNGELTSRAEHFVSVMSASVESEVAPTEGCQSGLLWSS